MTSSDNTVISLPGQTITDASGNTWSIVNGQVAINGKTDASTANVIQMAYEKGVVWQKNSANLWWGKTSPGASWGPANGTVVDAIPNQVASASGSIVTVSNGMATGALTDASGNTWSISGGQVTLNGVADPTTRNVVELAYAGGRVWQENTAGLWWSKGRPVDGWSSGSGSPVRNVTRTWDGSNAAFETASHWSASGVPQSGDTAAIASGTVSVGSGSASGVNFSLRGGEADFLTAGSYSIGTLSGSGTMQFGYPYQGAMVTTTGISMSGGNLTVGEFFNSPSKLIIHGNSSLTGGATLTVSAIGHAGPRSGAPFENDGIMTVNGSTLSVGSLSGTGKIVATANSSITVMDATAGETIDLQSAHLTIGGPAGLGGSTAMKFLAPVTDFGSSSSITLNNTQATREVFVQSAPTAGELFLYNGSALVADMHISGQAKIFASFTPSGSSGSVTLTASDTGHSLPFSAS